MPCPSEFARELAPSLPNKVQEGRIGNLLTGIRDKVFPSKEGSRADIQRAMKTIEGAKRIHGEERADELRRRGEESEAREEAARTAQSVRRRR